MTLLYFVLAFLALGILVFIHELGHYFVAKWVGMHVEVFSIGFGKPLLKWKRKTVQWQLGWLPFGGFVKITGMEFGKKEKNATYVEPHDIPNGFFAYSPWKRMAVAMAGPLANFILAFIIFLALYLMGGREKPFSDFTRTVGWVDPSSEIYEKGVRPGDLLTSYNGNAFNGSKDLLYAAMLGNSQVKLEGYHVDYKSGEKIPFQETIETYPYPGAMKEGILTTGILNSAKYLIYDRLPNGKENPLPEGSPLIQSGIAYGDRIVWADGYTIFSLEELSYLLNDQKAFLTVRRGDRHFTTRQPRVFTADLTLPTQVKNEVVDWVYEAGIKTKWQQLRMLPYLLAADGTVLGNLQFIDEEAKNQAFSKKAMLSSLEAPLQVGDQVVAIDGVPIHTAYQLLDLIQTHHALLIVKKEGLAHEKISSNDEDALFEKSFNLTNIEEIAHSIGTKEARLSSGEYRLLRPVEPKKLDQFALTAEDRDKFHKEMEAQKSKLMEIKNERQRAKALRLLDQQQNRYALGVFLQDESVLYNPHPLTLFASVFKETWQTLKALLMGYLSPKWISGPIGIVQVIHQGWAIGIGEALFWIGAISVNLAFLNLLPIPVLDGGYILLSLWEMVTGRKLKGRTMERLIIPFVVLMIGLVIFLTFQDIFRLF